MSHCRALFVLAAVAVLAAIPAVAHDLWIIPKSFRPQPGSPVELEVRVGESFPVSMNGPKPESLARFALVSAAGESRIEGAATKGKVLAAVGPAAPAGTSAIVLEGGPSHIVLSPEEFKAYLLEEGLAHIHDERGRRGEAGKEGREDYSRHSKSLIRGGPGDSVATRPLGLKLELVPKLDPYDLAPGQPLPVAAFFEGRPLPGLELRAYREGGPVLRARTGADGTATLTLDQPGPWCIAYIHMMRCTSCAEADWRSYFGSLTFELP